MKIIKIFVLTLLFNILLNIGISYADIVKVNVPKSIEDVKSAKGIVVSDGKINFIDNVNYTKNNLGVLVTFDVKDLNEDVLIGAYIEDENLEKHYSVLKSGLEYIGKDKSLPLCQNKKVDISMLDGNNAVLKELVVTRKNIQKKYDAQIKSILDDNMIYVLSNLEKYFGLTYDKPLSSELPSQELLLRLSYLKIAIKNLDVHKLNRIRVEKEGFREQK